MDTQTIIAELQAERDRLDQAIAALDKVMAMANLPDQIKKVAQSEKDRAEKAKTAKK